MRKMLWHNTFTDAIENAILFSNTFTLSILTLVNAALNMEMQFVQVPALAIGQPCKLLCIPETAGHMETHANRTIHHIPDQSQEYFLTHAQHMQIPVNQCPLDLFQRF